MFVAYASDLGYISLIIIYCLLANHFLVITFCVIVIQPLDPSLLL
jgi:hypothetical protein